MIKRLLSVLFLYFIVLNSDLYSESKVFIEVKIEKEIITNIDILNEKKYLIALNNNLKNLNRNQLYILSKNSLIREKVKKIELVKIFDFEKSISLADGFIKNIYKSLNFKNQDEFVYTESTQEILRIKLELPLV